MFVRWLIIVRPRDRQRVFSGSPGKYYTAY